jgi:phage-related tail protein
LPVYKKLKSTKGAVVELEFSTSDNLQKAKSKTKEDSLLSLYHKKTTCWDFFCKKARIKNHNLI